MDLLAEAGMQDQRCIMDSLLHGPASKNWVSSHSAEVDGDFLIFLCNLL